MSSSPLTPEDTPASDDAAPERMPPAAPRRSGLTPEQRRFLGTPRAVRAAPESPRAEEGPTSSPGSAAEERTTVSEDSPPVADPLPETANQDTAPPRRGNVAAQANTSRAIELRRGIQIAALLLALPLVFLAGRRFDYFKALISSGAQSKEEAELGPDKYPDATAEELITTGLAAEKRGDWAEAVDRYIAAKRKNRAVPGLLFRIGKGSFDRGDFNGADVALGHALRFGENIPVAHHYRGLIAVQRRDLAAATRHFEAAANAEPFVSDFRYFWGEVLRLDQKPREAIRRYSEAIDRTPNEQDAALCKFKIRLARLEAAETDAVVQELEEMRRAGPLSVDWLMTDAAIQLRSGNTHAAAKLIWEARTHGITGLFRTCGGDTFFVKAGETHPEIAAALAPPAPPLG